MAIKNDNEEFIEASQIWDLEGIYKLFSEAKREFSPRSRKGLTDTEKLYLRGLLCGFSPGDIARKFSKSAKSSQVYVCKTLYQYFKNLPEAPQEDIGNWRNINQWLEKSGYKLESSGESLIGKSLPKETKLNVTCLNLIKDSQNNTISIDINLKLVFPSDTEIPSEDHNATNYN